MYPTVTVEHLASVPTAADESDDMKIYEFDRDASMDWTWISGCVTNTMPGRPYVAHDEVLAA
ncbi:hypothetical protein ABZX92_13455 [Lentzea sp. NPDC006480]|uniref:hypothetical protein n=1 Tax=Lentzea sp. NPDC006480 TaxID=3157176 RepID=UPI0033BB4B78